MVGVRMRASGHATCAQKKPAMPFGWPPSDISFFSAAVDLPAPPTHTKRQQQQLKTMLAEMVTLPVVVRNVLPVSQRRTDSRAAL